MIHHPSLGQLRARTANELRPEQCNRIDAHVNRCVRCRTENDWLNGMRAALGDLPVYTAEPDAWRRIRTRVASGDVVILPEPRGVSRRLLRQPAVAALLVFAFAAAAAAMIGTSTVREWLAERASTGNVTPAIAPALVPDSVQYASEIALMIAPENGTIAVNIEAPSAGTRLRVRMIDGSELEVHATGGGAAARFRSAAGQLTIVQPAAGEIVLGVPRSVRLVTVHANGRELLRAQGSQLHLRVPADTAGLEILLPLGLQPTEAIKP